MNNYMENSTKNIARFFETPINDLDSYYISSFSSNKKMWNGIDIDNRHSIEWWPNFEITENDLKLLESFEPNYVIKDLTVSSNDEPSINYHKGGHNIIKISDTIVDSYLNNKIRFNNFEDFLFLLKNNFIVMDLKPLLTAEELNQLIENLRTQS